MNEQPKPRKLVALNPTKDAFLNLLKENVKDYNKPLMMNIQPKKGWKYQIISSVTDVVYSPYTNETVFISNAFSDKVDAMSVQDLINKIENAGNYVAFEIYGCDKNSSNEQFITICPPISDVDIREDEEYVSIHIGINFIRRGN